MHFQGPQTAVLFGTVLAVERRPRGGDGGAHHGDAHFRAGGTVRELVAGQTGRATAVLAAVGALEALGRIRAGRIGRAGIVLLSAAGAGLRAQVQRPRRTRNAGRSWGETEG